MKRFFFKCYVKSTKKMTSALVVVTLASDGSVSVPCSECSRGVEVKQEDVKNAWFRCPACNRDFSSPFGTVSVRIRVREEDWDMLVDETWDVC